MDRIRHDIGLKLAERVHKHRIRWYQLSNRELEQLDDLDGFDYDLLESCFHLGGVMNSP